MKINSLIPLNSQEAIDRFLSELFKLNCYVDDEQFGQILLRIRKIKLQLYIKSKIEEHNKKVPKNSKSENIKHKNNTTPKNTKKAKKEKKAKKVKTKENSINNKAKEKNHKRIGRRKRPKGDGSGCSLLKPVNLHIPDTYCYTHNSLRAISIPMGGKNR